MNNSCVIATRPVDNVGDKRWESMHHRFVDEARKSESEVVFIGDSIIQQLQFSSLWNERINALHCLNFGIGGDRVENVLWRISNGELNFHTRIKVVVIFVGTNNTDCMPENIFEGILELVKVVKAQLSDVEIILPTLLPRGQNPNPFRECNDRVNTLLISKFRNPEKADEHTSNVHLVEIHENIVQCDQTISHHIMYDYLHLTDAGYTKIFGPVYDLLVDILSMM